MCQRKPRLFCHMPALAMDGNKDFWPNPIIERGKFRLPRMAGHMHMRLLFGNGQDVTFGKLVHDHANSDFITRYLLRRENNRVACFQLHRVIALGYARQSRTCLALPPCGDHDNVVTWKAIDALHIHRLRHIFQIAIRLRGFDNPVERASCETQGATTFARDLA